MLKQLILIFIPITGSISQALSETTNLTRDLIGQAAEMKNPKSQTIRKEVKQGIEILSQKDKVINFNKKPEIPRVPIDKLKKTKEIQIIYGKCFRPGSEIEEIEWNGVTNALLYSYPEVLRDGDGEFIAWKSYITAGLELIPSDQHTNQASFQFYLNGERMGLKFNDLKKGMLLCLYSLDSKKNLYSLNLYDKTLKDIFKRKKDPADSKEYPYGSNFKNTILSKKDLIPSRSLKELLKHIENFTDTIKTDFIDIADIHRKDKKSKKKNKHKNKHKNKNNYNYLNDKKAKEYKFHIEKDESKEENPDSKECFSVYIKEVKQNFIQKTFNEMDRILHLDLIVVTCFLCFFRYFVL